MTMTHLLTLLADCERWLGIEPLGEEQWAEVAELRERVRQALSPSCGQCMGSGVVARGIGLPGAVGVGYWFPVDHPANRVTFSATDTEAEVPLPTDGRHRFFRVRVFEP
jgi:hypothetical protein